MSNSKFSAAASMASRCVLTMALVALVATSAHAVVFTLGGPDPSSAGVDTDTTSALYASGRDGSSILIVQIGAVSPDGGVFSDLGVPSISSQGAVVFGAETMGQDQRPRWDIYRAEVGAPPTSRIVRVLDGARISAGCRPAFKSDPYPVAGEDGAVAFLAPEASGRDAVFRFANGQLTCVARVGDRTVQGHTLRMLYFGSADIAPNGQFAFLARIKDDAARDGDRAALVLADGRSPISEIAIEGEAAPGGGRFGPSFGRPAITLSRAGSVVAFTNRNASVNTAYVSSASGLARSFHTGTHTTLGALTYISDGRPGVLPDGSMVVSGACRSKSAVFFAKDGELTPIKREGDRTQFGTRLGAFVDPSVTSSGLVFLGGHDDTGQQRLFVFESREAAQVPIESMADASRTGRWMPPFFPGSLEVNERGDLVFLGAAAYPDPVAVRTIRFAR